jgi:subtilisin family serine protease
MHRVHALALPLALVLVLAGEASPQAAATSARPAPTRVEIAAEVWEELARSADGRVHVVVVLRALEERLARDPRVARAAVALREELVLASLRAGEFELAYRYRNFPALSGIARAEALQLLAVHPDVESVGLDLEGRPALDESVPYIRADRVQDVYGYTGLGTTVAVLDTGVDSDHPDLADSLRPGAMHFLSQGADVGPGAEDFSGHGTNVTGIVTSNGTIAPRGVAPDTGVLAIQVIHPTTGTGFLSDWAAAIDHVVSVRASHPHLVAINISLVSSVSFTGCPCDAQNPANQLLANAIQAAAAHEIVTVAASGNGGNCDRIASPACVSGAVAVAGVRIAGVPDKITAASDLGACIDLAAPGANILSTGLAGGTVVMGGTSQAAAHVTGVVALMAERRPHWNPVGFPALLELTGAPTSADCAPPFPLPPRIDALAAVRAMMVRRR